MRIIRARYTLNDDGIYVMKYYDPEPDDSETREEIEDACEKIIKATNIIPALENIHAFLLETKGDSQGDVLIDLRYDIFNEGPDAEHVEIRLKD